VSTLREHLYEEKQISPKVNNSQLQYSVVHQLNENDWQEFLMASSSPSVFQTPEMFKVFEDSKNFSPLLTALIDQQGKILAVLVSVYVTNFNFLVRGFTKRSVVWGGPVVKDNDPILVESILSEYLKKVKDYAIFSEFRNDLQQKQFRSQYEKLGFMFEDHLNIFIDLTKSQELLWRALSKSLKNRINKVRRLGLEVKIIQNEQHYQESYKILKQVYQRAKLPIPGWSLFQAAIRHLVPKGLIKFFGAFYEGKLVGVRIVICYNNQLYDWYAGSYQEYYKIFPNDLLPWEVFMWGKDNGYTLFDFGGAGNPHKDYGVRDYKSKFSKEMENPGRFTIVHKPTLMTIGKYGFDLYQKIIPFR
jgi:hypothetical protein